ncbi:hypothetical protein EX30DRAFT_396674 [Ascodesmis nigricans]|uniref:Potassium channel tetramerisation-type BTB domain-containing protein n=1 Tax=Ascodesmis nigricans TaxID=341454 RepID=A0A4S2MTL1_9PEZI|nr:hypothetical protein EX30DRAFT_396674 [Ascodesmis nigricans]
MSSVHTPSSEPGIFTSQNVTPTSRGGNHWFPDIPKILPHEMVFPIQIGSELFRLSGASISSDAPSYFSQFFERQLAANGPDERPPIRTLYIDRDPETFRDIARHLQGYHISPRDGAHFVRLFADAQFYNLPKLISQLFESEIYISIGGQPFQIHREIFQSPGNTPNFFTLGFAVFFSNPHDVFPGLNREGLLRPPSILPPEVPNRDPDVFAEILHLLRGYPLRIRDEEHRARLVRDCRYYSFKGLEQKLCRHEIAWNGVSGRWEIVMRMPDLKPSGISVVESGREAGEMEDEGDGGDATTEARDGDAEDSGRGIPIMYARPFVDEQPRELVLEIGNEATTLDPRNGYAEFSGIDKKRVAALVRVIKSKLREEWGAGEGEMGVEGGDAERVRFVMEEGTHVELDGTSIRAPETFMLRHRVGVGVTGAAGGDPPPPPRSDAMVEFAGGDEARSRVQAAEVMTSSLAPTDPHAQQRKRLKRTHGEVTDEDRWIVKRGLWRLRVQRTRRQHITPSSTSTSSNQPRTATTTGLEIVLVAVKLDAFTGELGRNQKRSFLA